jgi:hypothetical protein
MSASPRVVDIDTGIQDGHHDVVAAGRDLPGILHLDQLMGVLIGKVRVVWLATEPVAVVRLRVFDLRVPVQLRAKRRDITGGLQQIARPPARPALDRCATLDAVSRSQTSK